MNQTELFVRNPALVLFPAAVIDTTPWPKQCEEGRIHCGPELKMTVYYHRDVTAVSTSHPQPGSRK